MRDMPPGKLTIEAFLEAEAAKPQIHHLETRYCKPHGRAIETSRRGGRYPDGSVMILGDLQLCALCTFIRGFSLPPSGGRSP